MEISGDNRGTGPKILEECMSCGEDDVVWVQ